MDVLLVILSVAFALILTAINIYLLALYVHTDDKGFGTVLYCKILVVLGLTLCQSQALMIPLDVANQSAILSTTLDMTTFWFFLYIIVLCFVTILLPFALFFYQTDEEESYMRRAFKAFMFTLAANIISVLLLFISWIFFKYVDLPLHVLTLSSSTVYNPALPITVTGQTASDTTLTIETSLAVYIIAIMSFIGWIFVVIFGGVGLFALPIDMVNEFRNRPKARKSDEMRKIKDKLVRAINDLLQEGERLKKVDEENAKNEEGGFFAKWRGGRAVNNQLTEFKAKYFALNEQYELFQLELTYANTNPVIPVLKLILGVLFFITSLMWLLQIILGSIVKGILNRPLIPFMNEMLIGLVNRNAGFVATGIFAYLCLYLIWCVQKGNIKFGIRVPCCCRFHPMKQNETWMNSFLFNVIVLLIASVGVIQLCISSFPTYTRNSQIYMIIGIQLRYMRFYTAFYQNNVFHIAFVIMALLSLLYLLFTCNRKPDYMKKIDMIRNKAQEDD